MTLNVIVNIEGLGRSPQGAYLRLPLFLKRNKLTVILPTTSKILGWLLLSLHETKYGKREYLV